MNLDWLTLLKWTLEVLELVYELIDLNQYRGEWHLVLNINSHYS